MDASRQTIMLPAGFDVTLNIGLGMGANPTRLTIPHRLRTISKLLPQVMKPGYIAELRLTPNRVWHNEPMMVVQGTFRDDVADHTLLWDGVVEAEQDCIAIFTHGSNTGCLFGPRAEAWGEFNVNLFFFIGDRT